jgi:type I restriction enzyme, S subunit
MESSAGRQPPEQWLESEIWQTSDFGCVPRSWAIEPIGAFTKRSQYGLSLRGSGTGPYPILRMNCQDAGQVVLRDLQYVDIDEATFNAFRLMRGDLLFNRTNSYELVGRVALVQDDLDAVFASYLVRLSLDQNRLLPAYLNYFLNWEIAQSELKRLATRAVGQANINATKLSRFRVPVPPLDEQISIAQVLDRVRSAVEIARTSEEKTSALKRIALRELFTLGLRGEAQKDTEIGPVPESWLVSTLGQLTSLERGRFLHRPRNEPRFYGGRTPFVQTGDVVRSGGRIREYTQTLNDDGVTISRVFPAGTILITIAANIGFTGILQFDSACPDSLIAITPNEQLNTEFLEYWLQTQQAEMDRLAPKGTQKNINIQFLSPWPVVVPSREEQGEIVAIFDVIDQKIELHRNKRAILDKLFKALLHKLMTGEIRVTDLDLSALDHPAAASTLIPAQAGIQGYETPSVALDPRFCGGDEKRVEPAG